MTKRTRRSKNIDESDNENDPFWILSMDLLVEIFMKLPAKSIAKLIFVSKLWSSIIRSKDFTNLYITRSLTRPRLLFIRKNVVSNFLESCSQEDPSFDHQRVSIPSYSDNHFYNSQPVRGLICLRYATNLRIGNPSTGQFLTLPKAKTKRRDLYSFFGYDPVNDVYKVLCMTVIQGYRRVSPVVSEEHQVYTLGFKQKWRKISCKHPHLPDYHSRGICINGVVYYYAWIKNEKSLICFDLTSEDFSVVKLPERNIYIHLVNYGGKIASCDEFEGRHNLWVLQDAKKQEFLEVSLKVPSWRDLVGYHYCVFIGTLSTGQHIFALKDVALKDYDSCHPYFLISYDQKGNNAKRVLIEGTVYNSTYIDAYLDHVESPMLLPNAP